MTRGVKTNGLSAIFAVALGLMAAGCCGFDLDLGCGSCDTGCDTGCEAPTPCEPVCAKPCDPCAGSTQRPGGLPDEAKAGEAWCRVMVPAQYEEYEERVLAKPASTSREWIEPVYEEREKKVCCTPAQTKQIQIPAEYEERSEQVMTCAARTVWQKIPCEPKDLQEGEKQGDCWKLTEIPAQYRTVSKRVCTKEASCTTETIPPVYKTVMEKVMVKPGEWKCTPVEAEYKMVTRKRMSAPCRWEWRRNTNCDVPTADGDTGADASEMGDAPAGK